MSYILSSQKITNLPLPHYHQNSDSLSLNCDIFKFLMLQWSVLNFNLTFNVTTFNDNVANLDFKVESYLQIQTQMSFCFYFSFLSTHLRNQFDHTAEAVLPTLINLLPNSAKVCLCTGAHGACFCGISYCKSDVILGFHVTSSCDFKFCRKT